MDDIESGSQPVLDSDGGVTSAWARDSEVHES